jgi:hypothetical protein
MQVTFLKEGGFDAADAVDGAERGHRCCSEAVSTCILAAFERIGGLNGG